MTRDDIIVRLRDIMRDTSEVDVDWDSINGEHTIAELGFDSLSLLDLIYDVQQAFEIEFDAEDLADVKSVSELAAFLEDKNI